MRGWWSPCCGSLLFQLRGSAGYLLGLPAAAQRNAPGLLAAGPAGSAFAWVYGLSGPLTGPLVNRVQRKSAILGGLQFWSIVCALSALSRTFRQLLSLRAAEGLGEAIYYPASTSLISDYHGQRSVARTRLSSYKRLCGYGWRRLLGGRHGRKVRLASSFVVLGVLGSALGLVLARLLCEKPRGSADCDFTGSPAPVKTSREKLLAVLRVPTALVLMAAFVAQTLSRSFCWRGCRPICTSIFIFRLLECPA